MKITRSKDELCKLKQTLLRVKCYIKAIKDLFKYKVWIPHVYEDEKYYPHTIIIATDDSFRVSDSYEHKENEVVYKDAVLIKSKCIYCGKENQSWCSKNFWLKNYATREEIVAESKNTFDYCIKNLDLIKSKTESEWEYHIDWQTILDNAKKHIK